MANTPIPQNNVPYAEVVNRQGSTATISCPLCGGLHRHPIREGQPKSNLTWRVAGCDLYAAVNREQRARGYQFEESAA